MNLETQLKLYLPTDLHGIENRIKKISELKKTVDSFNTKILSLRNSFKQLQQEAKENPNKAFDFADIQELERPLDKEICSLNAQIPKIALLDESYSCNLDII